ncbi:hypothetical protein FRC06_004516 [Ceratobasidium sp. 370]|nr:hypothetical protein FRC06_004516 [Ceratobasidium sp. 370]
MIPVTPQSAAGQEVWARMPGRPEDPLGVESNVELMGFVLSESWLNGQRVWRCRAFESYGVWTSHPDEEVLNIRSIRMPLSDNAQFKYGQRVQVRASADHWEIGLSIVPKSGIVEAGCFFPTPAIDHAVAGLGAGAVAVLCVQPLDLLRIQFQVATSSPVSRNPLVAIWSSLNKIKAERGVRGLYRGVGTNVIGNATGWGMYFWFYAAIKSRVFDSPDPRAPAAPLTNLIASAEASVATTLLTNPIWVVKVRMFTTLPGEPGAYRGLWRKYFSISSHTLSNGIS